MSKNGFQGLELMEGRRAEIHEGSVRDLGAPQGCLPGMDEENRGSGAGRMGLAGHGAWGSRLGAGREQAWGRQGAGMVPASRGPWVQRPGAGRSGLLPAAG